MIEKLKWKFSRFMVGRYGTDSLYNAIAILIIGLLVLHIFTDNIALNIVAVVLIVWMFYRVLSKDIVSRRRENTLYVRYANKVKNKARIQIRRIKEFRTHRYRTCSNCKTTLRLPLKRGIHTTVCPKCGHSNKVTIRF